MYSLYVNFQKLHVSDIQKYDRKFHLSGLLSYQINHNWIKQNNIIELVDTRQLWHYKEFDRTKTPKYSESTFNINDKFSSIKDKGFFEPLHINCNPHTKKCYVDEGNHRLTYAFYNNIPFVPARVIPSSTSDGVSIPFHHRDLPKVI